jgi:hypothetical protein
MRPKRSWSTTLAGAKDLQAKQRLAAQPNRLEPWLTNVDEVLKDCVAFLLMTPVERNGFLKWIRRIFTWRSRFVANKKAQNSRRGILE